jgi:hypothetical protein
MRTGHLSGQLTPLHRPRCRRRGGSLGWSDSAPKLRRSVTSGMTSPADPPGRRGANNFAGRRLLFGRSQLRGPSRLAGFPLVGFGAKVESGSSDSTMAISSPRSRSELRDGRR